MNRFVIVLLGIILLDGGKNPLRAMDFSYGVGAAATLSRLVSFDGLGIHSSGYPKYSYPVGFTGSLLAQVRVSDSFFLRTGMSILNHISKVEVALGAGESYAAKELRVTSIHLPLLLKMETDFFSSPFFLIGPEIGYLVDADYTYKGRFGVGNRKSNITGELPQFDISVALGIGQEFSISNIKLLLELKLMLGITRYEYEDDEFVALGRWKNSILQFGLGFMIP